MAEELTKEEIDQRARNLARRVMARRAAPQEWPKKAAPKATPDLASKPEKPARSGEAS